MRLFISLILFITCVVSSSADSISTPVDTTTNFIYKKHKVSYDVYKNKNIYYYMKTTKGKTKKIIFPKKIQKIMNNLNNKHIINN